MTLRTVAVSLALSLACALPLYAGPNNASVSGTVVYRERVALTPGAVFEVTLEDVSGGGHGKVVARMHRSNPGQVPIPFEIEYKRRRIDPAHDYVVRATILERGQPRFVSARDYPVLTHHHGNHVRIMMRGVGAGRTEEHGRGHESNPMAGLNGRRWGLVSLDGHDVTVPAREREPWIELEGHSMKATGSGGCNRFSGSYEGAGSSLRFGRLVSTQMACASLDTERAFFRALERTRQYRVRGRMLDLMDDRGEILARLEERNR